MENCTDLSNIKTSKIEVEETTSFGTPDKLHLKIDGKKIASFYYNMKGYNQDFYLFNDAGTQYGFGGDRSKSHQVADFKAAIKAGFVHIKPFK
jgi:hypothetical protein